MKVFVYGTLKQGFGNHEILGDSKYLFSTKLNLKYAMIDTGSFPALVPSNKTHGIFGEVYDVSLETLEELDWLEGVPHLYKRIHTNGLNLYVDNCNLEGTFIASGNFT